ncbi:MAG: DUF1553 domain-containing protein [Bacteroidota bacterium]
MTKQIVRILCFAMLVSCGVSLPDEVAVEYEALPQVLDFNTHVKPVLSDKCYLCHGPDEAKQQAGLRLDLASAAYGELPQSPGDVAIDPGSLRNSEVFKRIMSDDPELIMPTTESKIALSPYEKAVLLKWIEDGAEYKPHWAFLPPEKPNTPSIESSWALSEIDLFIERKQKTKGLGPSQTATKERLIRRLSLDLTGLPPTLDEIDDFVNDQSEDAYEKVVDRLLASPHYGEKMANDWMDLARYADTYGYQADMYRDMSPWRDWVIKSFNENMPYDEFAKWQIAGDLLPNPTKEQMLATAFNRLHPTNAEGGIVDEEFRVEYVADRTSVVGTGFMALTLNCARCHDHKFDPISQKEFFSLTSFFNNQNESGQISWNPLDVPVPNMLLPTDEQEATLEQLETQVVEKEQLARKVRKEEVAKIAGWIEEGGHTGIQNKIPTKGLVARYQLEGNLKNDRKSGQVGEMKRQFSKQEYPEYAAGEDGKGLKMNGDTWLHLSKVGIYQRSEPFSVGIWVNLPQELENGVVFHKNHGTRLYAYKGYHLNIKDNKIEVMLSHTYPDNAIVELSTAEIPKDEWVHLMMTYDGSSSAEGLNIYMNGTALETEVQIDNLYKDIIYNRMSDYINKKGEEPPLQIGARWRGKGIGGASVDDIHVYNREVSALEVMMIGDASQANEILQKPTDRLNEDEKTWLTQYFLGLNSKAYQTALSQLEEARDALVDSTEFIQEIPIMREMDEPRPTYVLERGQYDAHGEKVDPGSPARILPWKEEYPQNRLGLVQWIFDEENPLTARVAVNRYWQNYFGRGIVRTTEDFGNQGEMPSHPELLDYLAISFRESGWDVKALQKMIVMSATYRQSSFTSQELLEKDPQNIYLARGPKIRLTSEMMRDNALVASGLFNDEIGGKSVKPYQPDGYYQGASGGTEYVQSSGDDLYKRSLYVYWRRTFPHPTLSTFDQPERAECTVRRQKTNTPLQALALLNDPAYIEASKVLGEKITRASDAEEGVREAYQRLTGIQPKDEELKLLLSLQQAEYEKFNDSPEKAKGWLEAGEYQIDESLDSNMVAANAVVASVILNSDASITKR